MSVLITAVIQAGTGASESVAQAWQSTLQTAFSKFAITSETSVAALLANIGVESASLTQFAENLNYSAQGLANVWPNRFAVDPKANPKVPNTLAISLARKPQDIANTVYAGRLGNGPAASGEGWKYRGQGPIQVTGKDNMIACGAAIGVDLVKNPELLQGVDAGALSAGWFFSSHGCIPFGDAGNFAEVVRRVNGALPSEANHGPLRIARYGDALDAIKKIRAS